MAAQAYAELLTTSNFSFLRGGSHAEELVWQAASSGLSGLGICDRNSFAGVVRGYVAMKDLQKHAPDFRYVVGTRLVFADGTPDIIAYPTDRAAYGRLCALLTLGNRRAPKGECLLNFSDLRLCRRVAVHPAGRRDPFQRFGRTVACAGNTGAGAGVAGRMVHFPWPGPDAAQSPRRSGPAPRRAAHRHQ